MGQQAQQQQAQHNRSAAFHRQAAYHDHLRRRRRGGRGRFGLLGRLVGLVFTLVTIAVAVGIFLLILSQAQPAWFDTITSWFENTF
jgi:hypothetical protein